MLKASGLPKTWAAGCGSFGELYTIACTDQASLGSRILFGRSANSMNVDGKRVAS